VSADDRKLLQAAAKAAGIVLVPYTFDEDAPWGEHEGFTVAEEGPDEWNPLQDDGQALRLAVALRMDIAHFSDHVRADVMCGPDCHESNRDDPAAATRRAIVRAAAATPPHP